MRLSRNNLRDCSRSPAACVVEVPGHDPQTAGAEFDKQFELTADTVKANTGGAALPQNSLYFFEMRYSCLRDAE
jgi:hypothetical protein